MGSKRILCVDDDPSILAFRKLLFEEAGYAVVTAPSGAQALETLDSQERMDLVLLDYLMPGMNGDELASRVRKRYPNIRILAVSGVEDLPPELLNNVDGHLQKGEPPQLLVSLVAQTLNQSNGRESGQPPSKVVLCVDDEKLQLQLRKMLLESAGFSVLQARSATEAMDTFQSNHVDAVVMDYWLSGKNGTALAEEMKQLHPRIPIIMLSGYSALPGEGAIVDAWLRKGDVKPEDLVHEVNRLIDLRKDLEQHAITE